MDASGLRAIAAAFAAVRSRQAAYHLGAGMKIKMTNPFQFNRIVIPYLSMI
jgi:hypothetical protein